MSCLIPRKTVYSCLGGAKARISSMTLISGFTMRFKDLRGKRFGRLVAVKFMGRERKRSRWLCRCDCGNEKVIDYTNLAYARGQTRSCGCLKEEKLGTLHLTHGYSDTKIYRCWSHLKGRCENPTDFRYPLYGGRGIKVLWKSFEEFLSDMLPSFEEHVQKNGAKNTTLDRKNNNGDYCKENCHWVTWKAQQNNRRSTRIVEYRGDKMSITQLAERLNIGYERLREKIAKGMDVEKAVTLSMN